MTRVSRLGFFGGLCVGLFLMGIIWLGASGALRTGSGSLSAGYNDIASIHLQPVPEGPNSPTFVPKPRAIGEKPLALLRYLVPNPLPTPSDQPSSCSDSGDLIVKLKDGQTITYGPCRWPWQISQLWGALIEASDLTQTDLTLPNTPAVAEQEQVRQAVAVGIARNLIRHQAHYDPTMVTCQPAPITGKNTQNGYRCAVVLHSETSATGIRHMFVCAELSGGHLIQSRTKAGSGCEIEILQR